MQIRSNPEKPPSIHGPKAPPPPLPLLTKNSALMDGCGHILVSPPPALIPDQIMRAAKKKGIFHRQRLQNKAANPIQPRALPRRKSMSVSRMSRHGATTTPLQDKP